MKDFDQEWAGRKSIENRTFKIAGETFVMLAAVRPEVFDDGEDLPEDAPLEETMKQIDARFLSMIELENGEAEKRYRALRAREGDGLSVRDITEVIDWIVEAQTGRPPTSPSASSATPLRTATRSTVASSSRDLAAGGRG